MSRRKDETYGKALDLWQAPPDAGEPMICIATSYTFDPTFFETECVGRFLQMEAHPSESASVAYLIEREEKLAGSRVHALIDRRHARDKESLRWDIIGVLVPGAVQHAKLSLLAWKDHVRLIIGSGNLTEPGYRKNVEVFGTIDLSRHDGGNRAAIVAAIDFVGKVSEFCVGVDAADTPRGRLKDSLRRVQEHIRRWPDAAGKLDGVPVFNTPDQSAIEQVESLWPSGMPPRQAYVVSPFFDHPPNDRRAVERLKALLAKRGETSTSFFVKTEPLLNGQRRVYAPKAITESTRAGDLVDVTPLSAAQQGEFRDVHSKLLSLGNDYWSILMIGSSNFTSAGLGVMRGKGNLEANLVYRVKTDDQAFRALDAIWPEHTDTPIDLDANNLLWEPCFEEDEDGGVGASPLPAAFQEALFVAGQSSALKLTLADGLPPEWMVRLPAGRIILSSANATAGSHTIPWQLGDPPFVLEVSWVSGTGGTQVASWPVNVSNPASLPPPEILRTLTLDELLDILSSTRPLPAAVEERIRKRDKASGTNPELDPLKRLDSRAFLLRRTKRVARALDRLKERLERPALTQEAFEWRLRGVVGPMALVDAFVAEASLPGEAKFCLAELALALRRVDPALAARGGLATDVITASLSEVIVSIEQRAQALESSPDMSMLDAYVSAAFQEALAK
jgi:hypothetical protein